MAGHSKWADIKHRKAAQDKKRGKQPNLKDHMPVWLPPVNDADEDAIETLIEKG